MDFITNTFIAAYEIIRKDFNSFQNLAAFSLTEFSFILTSCSKYHISFNGSHILTMFPNSYSASNI